MRSKALPLSRILTASALSLGLPFACSTERLDGVGTGVTSSSSNSGSSSSGSTTGSGGGRSSSVSTSSAGGSSSVSTSSAGGSGGVAPLGSGSVTVVNTSFVGPNGVQPYQDLVAAFFQVAVPSPPPSTCTTTLYDTCTVTTCPQVYQSNPGPAAGAGVITITGTQQTLTTVPDDGGTYPVERGDVPFPIWNGGETIGAMATGDVIPPFTLSGVAPSDLDLQTPALPTGGPISIDRTKDLAFTWISNGWGTIMISLTANVLLPNSVAIQCQLVQAPGSGVVPKAALQQLPADWPGTLSFQAAGTWFEEVSGWSVTLELLGGATWAGMPTTSSSFKTIN